MASENAWTQKLFLVVNEKSLLFLGALQFTKNSQIFLSRMSHKVTFEWGVGTLSVPKGCSGSSEAAVLVNGKAQRQARPWHHAPDSPNSADFSVLIWG